MIVLANVVVPSCGPPKTREEAGKLLEPIRKLKGVRSVVVKIRKDYAKALEEWKGSWGVGNVRFVS